MTDAPSEGEETSKLPAGFRILHVPLSGSFSRLQQQMGEWAAHRPHRVYVHEPRNPTWDQVDMQYLSIPNLIRPAHLRVPEENVLRMNCSLKRYLDQNGSADGRQGRRGQALSDPSVDRLRVMAVLGPCIRLAKQMAFGIRITLVGLARHNDLNGASVWTIVHLVRDRSGRRSRLS